MYENRDFIVFPVSSLSLIDFSEVLETSQESLVISADGLKTFVKYDGSMPASVANLPQYEGPYTYTEICELLDTEEWQTVIEGEA